MRASDLKQVLFNAVLQRDRILLVGQPGLGKTAVIHQTRAAIELHLGNAVDLTVLYASVSDPTDFKGFYCVVNGKPEILPFGELDKIYNATSLHIVFLDDLGQGVPAVQAAAMSFLDRVKDNPNVCVLGATNRREDRAGVSGLLEPVKSRFDSIIHMDFDMDDFVEHHLQSGMPIELIAFNKFRPNLMYSAKATPDLVNGPCPRTVEALGKLMKLNLPAHLEFETYQGAVGLEYTTEFMGFLPIWRKLPNVDSILMDPMGVKMPEMNDPHAPSIYFAVCAALSRKASETNFDRIVKFADRLPSEFSIMLIVDSVKHDINVQNTRSYIEWQSRNKSVLI